MSRIVLAYSGGLSSSVALERLRERGAEIVTVTCDVGQAVDLEMVRDRALSRGAVRAHVLDVREAFARDFIVPALRADARAGRALPLPAALARPIVAQKLLEIAAIERADTLAHGGGTPGRPAAFDALLQGLGASHRVVAPNREQRTTREELRAFAVERQLSLPAESPWRTESTLWGRTIVWCGNGDPPASVPDELFWGPRHGAHAAHEDAVLELAFERGRPVAVNGVALPLLDLIASVATIATAYDIGRVIAPASTRKTLTNVAAVSAPAAVLLHAGHSELTRLSHTEDLAAFADDARQAYSALVADGRWFSPLREALDRFIEVADSRTTGVAAFTLSKGDYSLARSVLGDAAALQQTTKF